MRWPNSPRDDRGASPAGRRVVGGIRRRGARCAVHGGGGVDGGPPGARRRAQFATARACARRALAGLGREPVALLPGPGGAPQWPSGVVGSITHCEGYRAAVAAPAGVVAALGIDAEPAGAVAAGGAGADRLGG
ncbi:hypothetical protein [Streptomyces manipurensis]|uniref:hypothetical protein n=1 Tax=Streptomyces manipurensis TaxID=1077945 RepID=UPI003C6F2BB2